MLPPQPGREGADGGKHPYVSLRGCGSVRDGGTKWGDSPASPRPQHPAPRAMLHVHLIHLPQHKAPAFFFFFLCLNNCFPQYPSHCMKMCWFCRTGLLMHGLERMGSISWPAWEALVTFLEAKRFGCFFCALHGLHVRVCLGAVNMLLASIQGQKLVILPRNWLCKNTSTLLPKHQPHVWLSRNTEIKEGLNTNFLEFWKISKLREHLSFAHCFSYRVKGLLF